MNHRSFRIGHLCTTKSLGGLELNVLRLAVWMDQRGHSSAIYCRPGSPIALHAEEMGVKTIPLAPKRKYFDRPAVRSLGSSARESRIEILFVHPAADIHLAASAKRFSSDAFRLAAVQHMQIGISKRDPFHTRTYRRLDAWITPLEYLKRNTLRETKIPEGKIHLIPFGIDTGLFDPARCDKQKIRLDLGIPPDAFLAGTIGRLDPGKGQEYLVQALALLRDILPDLHLLIVGDETREESWGYGKRLRNVAEKQGLSDRVHFHPHVSDPAPLYAAMDLFCLTSMSETYGMVTIEAMAMGLPVVATDSAGTPEIVMDGKTGHLVPPGRPDVLAEAIRNIHRDPHLSSTLAVRARAHVTQGFSRKRQCEMYSSLIESLVREHRDSDS